jgi:cytochrome c
MMPTHPALSGPRSRLSKGQALHGFAVAGTALLVGLVSAPAARAADAAQGKAIFDRTCGACHTTQAGLNKVGPTLFDIVNRPIASVQGYDYSAKMRSVAKEWKVWDEKHLDLYLTNPRQVLHGVKMFFAVPDAKDRADVIAYLGTLK